MKMKGLFLQNYGFQHSDSRALNQMWGSFVPGPCENAQDPRQKYGPRHLDHLLMQLTCALGPV